MNKDASSLWRYFFVVFVLIAATVCLFWRLIDLNILQRGFLLQQSNARILRTVSIPTYRGMITDRYLQPLAISAQVDSIWVNPQLFEPTSLQIEQLAQLLKLPPQKIFVKTQKKSGKEFVYLKRGVAPAASEKIVSLKIAGVFCQHNYHRFYPQSEVAAHVIGFTNVDDQGQEGLELTYDTWLRGIPGKKKVIKDRPGNIITELGVIQAPRQGHNLILSLDNRIQYLAHETLRESIEKFSAKSGSIVVLDITTGEVLAMVNQPTFNPNHIEKMGDGRYRNRAMTDMFEPGSTMKAFSIASALESGKYNLNSVIDTAPGWLNVNGNVIRDEHNCGVLNLVKILQKSSDVGVAKITLSLPPEHFIELLRRVGFGERTNSAFPGEAAGTLSLRTKWRPFELATLSFGYGISVTTIQLAKAYAIIADHGLERPISLLKVDKVPAGRQVLERKIAEQMITMLEAVVQGGTGSLAKVPGFRVAGKTGTANIAGKNGYDKQHYVSSFVGIAPVSNPRLVVAVVIKDPRGEQHLGGMVAAPIFSKVMSGALRLMNVAPDDLTNESENAAIDSGEDGEN
ncbi:MAG: penicillin-binding protein 2 [Gammaproteobacteria bacterium]|nr:penicillin-binding protein 2 [Gammaproteobacteria bacterium]